MQKALAEKLSSSGHIKLQNAVSDIEDRYRDIVRLENVYFNFSTRALTKCINYL